MDISDLFGGVLMPWLKDQKPDEFASKLALFMVAWWLVKSEVRKHFNSIEQKLVTIATNVQDFTKALVQVETSHGMRIEHLEEKVKQIETHGG